MIVNAFPMLSIVVLLFPMGFFALASPPLLVLKHDTPLDGRFVRSMFNLYDLVVMTIAALAACAAKRFKRWHLAGMVVNVAQIAAVAWGLTRLVA